MSANQHLDSEKIIVLGLDSASPGLIFRWAQLGLLPTFAKLINGGVSGNLQSTLPPVTPPAWASFATGKNPGKHGVFDFEKRVEGSYKRVPVNATHVKAPTLWRILSDFGKTVGVVHVPLTLPPEQVNGYVVGDHTISNSLETYPPEIKSELLEAVADYGKIFESILSVAYVPGLEKEYSEHVSFVFRKEKEAAFHLLRHHPVDFFISHFFMGDQIQHFFWKFMDETHPKHDADLGKKFGNDILRYYQEADSMINELLNIAGDATIMIISDHGAGPAYKQVYVNHWLKEAGFLKIKRTRLSLAQRIMKAFGLTQEGMLDKAAENAFLRAVVQRIPRSIARRAIDTAPLSAPNLDDIDFANSQAYATGEMGQLFINLKGRDPEGIVEESDYSRVRDQLLKQLTELRDPEDGDLLVSAVHKREELYAGPYVESSADILFQLRGLSYITRRGPTHLEFTGDWSKIVGDTGNLSGWHRIDGLFMCYGPDIQRGKRVDARLIDILPTVLHMMHVPIPDDVDGRVLSQIFEEGSTHALTPPRYEHVEFTSRPSFEYSKEEEQMIHEKLRTLGYE